MASTSKNHAHLDLKKLIFAATILISGCSNLNHDTNPTAGSYFKNGLAAERAGNLNEAEKNYGLVLSSSDAGSLTPASIAQVKNRLGFIKGLLCKYEEAEQLLLESLEIEEKIAKPANPFITIPQFELARLYFDQNQFTKSISFFDRALILSRKRDITSKYSDPIGFSEALDDYSLALQKIGNAEKAEQLKKEAEQIRSNNKNLTSAYKRQRYKENCEFSSPIRSNNSSPAILSIKSENRENSSMPRIWLNSITINELYYSQNRMPFQLSAGRKTIGVRATMHYPEKSKSLTESLPLLFNPMLALAFGPPKPKPETFDLCLNIETKPGYSYSIQINSNWEASITEESENPNLKRPLNTRKSPIHGSLPFCPH